MLTKFYPFFKLPYTFKLRCITSDLNLHYLYILSPLDMAERKEQKTKTKKNFSIQVDSRNKKYATHNIYVCQPKWTDKKKQKHRSQASEYNINDGNNSYDCQTDKQWFAVHEVTLWLFCLFFFFKFFIGYGPFRNAVIHILHPYYLNYFVIFFFCQNWNQFIILLRNVNGWT